MKIYGFQIYVDGHIGAWSDTFYPTREDVQRDAQSRILDICATIVENQPPYDRGWNFNFDPDNPESCEGGTSWEWCMRCYNAVKQLLTEGSGGRVYAGDGADGTDTASGSEEDDVEERDEDDEEETDVYGSKQKGSPFDLDLHIFPYHFKPRFMASKDESSAADEVLFIPKPLFQETVDALGEAWGLVQEMCFHNPPGCDVCPLRCEQDEEDKPMETLRIIDNSNPDYWNGCEYNEIPEALRRIVEFKENAEELCLKNTN